MAARPRVIDEPASLWRDTVPAHLVRSRPPLDGDSSVDVCIVGGGYTGLWTAYYLLQRDPSLDVLVVEAQTVGFGASGRNGGWCSALLPQSIAVMAARHGPEAALAMRHAMIDTVVQVGAVVSREGIDCHFEHGGTVVVARHPAQVTRAHTAVAQDLSWGGIDGLRLLDGAATREHIGVPGALASTFNPHCARLHPARLAHGLAAAAERAGARLVDGTRATSITPGAVQTARGRVRARHVVRATEAWTPSLPGARREVVPVYSLVIATAPLPQSFWDDAGLARGQTFSEHRHVVVYGQRTADDRLVFGGRGAPYHFRSRVRARFDLAPGVFAGLATALVDLLPGAADVEITHRWGGPLAIARDWHASVHHDPRTGLGSAGGYVGDGVAASNLAGRTLADLVTGTHSPLTQLPWVGHRSPSWEPEPLRWAEINAGLRLAQAADALEIRLGRVTPLTGVLDRLTGH